MPKPSRKSFRFKRAQVQLMTLLAAPSFAAVDSLAAEIGEGKSRLYGMIAGYVEPSDKLLARLELSRSGKSYVWRPR